MEHHMPDWNFASATPTTTSTREEGDLWSSSSGATENVATLAEAGVLEHNYWLQTASRTPFEISRTDPGDSFDDIFNALQSCQLIDTARVEAEALAEHNVPLSWDTFRNPNQAEAGGSGSKRGGNSEMDDQRRCKSTARPSREQETDQEVREKLEDQRKARVKRTRSAAELHNMSERKRRDRIKENIKTLQQLIPNCNKSDRASVLDDAVKYLKRLKLQVEILKPSMVMAPCYGFHNTLTGLPATPFYHSPLFPTSPPLSGQAVSFPFFNARPQGLSPAAFNAVNTDFFPRFNYLTTHQGESSHWNSNSTPSDIDRQVMPAASQEHDASNLTAGLPEHRATVTSSPRDNIAGVEDSRLDSKRLA